MTTMHSLSIVIPVYLGERTLTTVVDELATLTAPTTTKDGHCFHVSEVVLVHDCGPDNSDATMRALEQQYEWVRTIWLSRNFGQHAATLAGMASSSHQWVVTMDEDGQHDPAHIADFLDVAMREQAQLVYASPVNTRPHGVLRNISSVVAKRVLASLFLGADHPRFESYRFIQGEIARSVAAYAGEGVYLDVALGWVVGTVAYADVRLRGTPGRTSGYSPKKLVAHLWRLLMSSGTRPLRMISATGLLMSLSGLIYALYLVLDRVVNNSIPAGWTSTMVVLLVSSGLILFFLGVIAEYIGVVMGMAMGRPLYLIVSDRNRGPHGINKDAPRE